MKAKGSVTDFLSLHQCGHILSEDGSLVYFDSSSLQGLDATTLSIGVWVEYEELPPVEGARADAIRPVHISSLRHKH
jgi:hypothetical protein